MRLKVINTLKKLEMIKQIHAVYYKGALNETLIPFLDTENY